jgi:hypothetical protein
MKERTQSDVEADLSLPDSASYLCDYCNEANQVSIDMSDGMHQEFIEECRVCCRPNVIHMEIDERGRIRIWNERAQD